MKGIEIAKKLQISTSTLRHYEAWGIVPKVDRAANGYRMYTKVHEAYYQCIRAMYAGFGMELIREIMPCIIMGRKQDALWLVNKAQVKLHTEKEAVQRTVELLELKELTELPRYLKKRTFTIGEVAAIAHTSASSIRHWEKEGLIHPERHSESGFRVYGHAEIRRVLIIRTVQRVAYSLDIVRNVLLELDKNDVTQAKEIALKSLEYLDYALIEQLKGLAYLQQLFVALSE